MAQSRTECYNRRRIRKNVYRLHSKSFCREYQHYMIDRAVSRSRTEIIGQMLEIATNFTDDNYRGNTNAISILKMMYKGFLPYAVLAEYVSLLLENEMLVYRKYER